MSEVLPSVVRQKSICVIGGAGYVGARLVPRLMAEGYAVTVVDTLWFGNPFDASVKLIQQDALTLPQSFFGEFGTVYFLAGLASDPMAEFDPALNFVSNLGVPAYVAYAARAAGVSRFIFADSCSVYGYTGGRECTEADTLNLPPYPYGVSKAQANCGLLKLVQPGFNVIALRKGTVSGWSPRMRFDLLVNAMYRSAWVDKKIVVNNAAISRPLLAIDDAVEGYMATLKAPSDISGTYNIVSQNVTVGQVGEEVQKHFKTVHYIDIPLEIKNIPDVRDYKASGALAEKVLGFHPIGSVATILAGLDEHFGPNFAGYNDDVHYNIRTFKSLREKKVL
ncbi:MAG: SDR family oxidoreductase [Minisyncoccia bacterium]